MEPILVGLEPPSNVERTLNAIKQDLYTSFASISAIALGPIIPVCYLPEPIEPPTARTLPHGMEIAAVDWKLVRGALMLSVEPADRIARLAQELDEGNQRGAEATGMLPLFPGIYLAYPSEATMGKRWRGTQPELHYDANDMIHRLGAPPRMRWRVSDLVCWRFTVGIPQRWWDDVTSEELWRVRLRKGATRAS